MTNAPLYSIGSAREWAIRRGVEVEMPACRNTTVGRILLVLLLIGAGGVSSAWAGGAENEADAPTFADVAPILYENCVTCHRAGEVAPMSLMTYEETRPWGRSIKNRVQSGDMPPWHADPNIGHFLNERRLTDAEKSTIARWVDAGAPEGDRSLLPPPPAFADGWQIGTPDVVIEMPVDFEVPADGEVAYQYFTTPTNFTDDRWVQAIEVRPGTRSVVHHILAFIQSPDGAQRPASFKPIIEGPDAEAAAERARARAARGGERNAERPPARVLIGTMAPGTNPMVFEPGSALFIPKGSELVFQLHYTAAGVVTTDRSKVGLIFADAPPDREVRTSAFVNTFFEIPPGASHERVEATVEFTEDVSLDAIFPHSHLRGIRWEYEITYPDGRSEPLLSVPSYDFNWQTYYVFSEPLQIPAGTRIVGSAWYDNSAANRSNPDPTTPVRWGEQTWEEMHYTGITYSVPAAKSVE